MSKIVIVNERDEVIGCKTREEITSNDIFRATSLWLTNSQDEVLLARRSFTKKHDPGKWGPAVAGMVEEGEDNESNISKEAEEEIGLKNIVFQKGLKIKMVGDHDNQYFCQWYLLVLDRASNQFILQKSEVESVKWVSKNDLKKEVYSHPERFIKAMQQTLGLF